MASYFRWVLDFRIVCFILGLNNLVHLNVNQPSDYLGGQSYIHIAFVHAAANLRHDMVTFMDRGAFFRHDFIRHFLVLSLKLVVRIDSAEGRCASNM